MTAPSGMEACEGGVLPVITMDLLTPNLADITPEGLSLTGDITGDEIGLTREDTNLSGALAVGLDLTKVEQTVCVTGVIEGTAVRECVRCLKDFEEPMAFSLRVVFEPEPKAKSKSGGAAAKRVDARRKQAEPVEEELDETGDEIYHYQGDRLDLAPMLREQVILSAPMHPLCKEDCAGLCAHCGKDLNEGPCQCPVEPERNPFHVLRGLKTELN